jgi:hypothetical protein
MSHRFASLTMLAVVVMGLLAGTATAAPGGNAESAKLCQRGGYLHYTRADGAPFKNQGACTSYATKGNPLIPVVVPGPGPEVLEFHFKYAPHQRCFGTLLVDNYASGPYTVTFAGTHNGVDAGSITVPMDVDEGGGLVASRPQSFPWGSIVTLSIDGEVVATKRIDLRSCEDF